MQNYFLPVEPNTNSTIHKHVVMGSFCPNDTVITEYKMFYNTKLKKNSVKKWKKIK